LLEIELGIQMGLKEKVKRPRGFAARRGEEKGKTQKQIGLFKKPPRA